MADNSLVAAEASIGSRTVVFSFDNAYSKITAKHVLFGAEVVQDF